MVVVAPQEAAQISIDDTADLSLHLQGAGQDITSDGFEFGRETLTVDSPGLYRIEISPASSYSEPIPETVLVRCKVLPLQEAADWRIAEAAATRAKQSKSLNDISSAMGAWKKVNDQSSIARTWMLLGDAVVRSDLGGARDAYEQAFAICRAIAELRCSAEAASNSGYASRQVGDFERSLMRLQDALADWKKLSLHLQGRIFPGEGRTLSNLGVLFFRVGDFAKAITTFDRARIRLKSLDPLAYARVLNNLGLCYLALAQYGEARVLFERTVFLEAGLQSAETDLIRTRINLGRTLMLEGHLPQALAMVQATASAKDPSTRAFALDNLGQILLQLQRIDEAEDHLNVALALHRNLTDKRGEGIALHYLGVGASRRGNFAAARELLEGALNIRRDCGFRDDAVDSLFELAQVELAAHNLALARRHVEDAAGLLESVRSQVPGPALRASFYARRRNLFDLLVTIAMQPDNEDAASDGLLAAEFGRGRALLDLIQQRRLSSQRPSEPIERQVRIRNEISLLSARLIAEPKEYKNLKGRIEGLLAEDEEVAASIYESLDRQEPGAQPLTSIRAVQESLSPESALLEYQLGERESFVWLVRDTSIVVFHLPPRSLVEAKVQAVMRLFNPETRLTENKKAAFQAAMSDLSRILLGPLQGMDLPPLIILAPDGDLQRVPFAALRAPGRGFLGTSHDLVKVPSAAFLLQAARPRPFTSGSQVLAFFDPVFSASDPRVPAALRRGSSTGAGLARLPFKDELTTISRLVPKQRREFFGAFDASTRTLLSQHLERFGIIHFSTHAMINDDIPELSRLVLSLVDREGRPIDGALLPHQFAGLRLNRSLIVLSACDTALGKNVPGEGLIGFSSSLFAAGASQLILTLSAVNAEFSSSFLSEVYRHTLSSEHSTPEHALTLARRTFVHSRRWADPYHWASFILVGVPAAHIHSVPDQTK